MDRVERPLSPHLQVYRPQITSILSILHRLTGLALSAGLLVLVYWLISLAGGSASYEPAAVLLSSGWLKLCYVGWSFCFFYHLCPDRISFNISKGYNQVGFIKNA